MLCCVELCYDVLCYVVLCCVMLCCAVLCCAVLCYVMLCCAVLCYVMLCCAVLCYVDADGNVELIVYQSDTSRNLPYSRFDVCMNTLLTIVANLFIIPVPHLNPMYGYQNKIDL